MESPRWAAARLIITFGMKRTNKHHYVVVLLSLLIGISL